MAKLKVHGEDMHIQYAIDPTGSFKNIDPTRLFDACGILVAWAVEEAYFNLPLKDAMERQYGYGALTPIDGIEISDNGTYKYPGDPVQAPLVTITRGNELMHIYQYSTVAIRDVNGKYFVTRMD